MATTRNSVNDIWGPRRPYVRDWPVRVDERTVEPPDHWVPSACVLCSNGCALDIGVKDGRMVGVRGRAEDRVNRGRLGPKGLHGWAANHSHDRLTRPLIRRRGHLQAAGWDEAMDVIVRHVQDIRAAHGALALGFYTSGQLFLEEYYTLAVIGKAGLGTPHMDGNTRLCTATAGEALKQSFGCDGQPGSYADIDVTDAVFSIGHNVAEQQTVLWMRLLDRRRGPNRPALVVVDPRRTPAAAEADIHLAPRPGTNLAVMNGLLHLLIKRGWLDRAYIEAHTVRFDELDRTVAAWTPERAATVADVPVRLLEKVAEILGTAPTLVSTVLQGVYQSMQATAAACQVNNLHLLRGLLGRPGCGLLQMNGQPTAQNTRECGADGDLPGFRNWHNPQHIDELARLWKVDRDVIPHWSPPTHALQIFRYCEQGSIKMLWISASNPAVSLPDLPRIRKILDKPGLFTVVQDAFLTETASRADVVLPAAIWGEKTGCLTNADRTVHLSRKAVEPPGEARSDLDIFLDFARRMDFRNREGQPLIAWRNPEEAFEAWKACSRGRPCDYSGLTYAKLGGGPGIQWPCTEAQPGGTPRLYADGRFPTEPERCETYGRDLDTGADATPEEYRASNPAGRAILRAADYRAPFEQPDGEYPLWLTTGRVVYHFHTRTKTGRVPELQAQAPDAFVEMSEEDAAAHGIKAGDLVTVSSRRGCAIALARITGIRRGVLFMPFHYGYWDDASRPRAANELTLEEWDPASKQPQFKYAAARIARAAAPGARERRQAAAGAFAGAERRRARVGTGGAGTGRR